MPFSGAGGKTERRAMENERNRNGWGWGGSEVPRYDMGVRERSDSEISGTVAWTRKGGGMGGGIYLNVSNVAARTSNGVERGRYSEILSGAGDGGRAFLFCSDATPIDFAENHYKVIQN